MWSRGVRKRGERPVGGVAGCQKPLEAVPTTLGVGAGRQEPGTSGAGGGVRAGSQALLAPRVIR